MRITYLVCVWLFLYGCANKVAPTGGLKDETPPKEVSTEPAQGTTLFSGDKISIQFDEYIQLKDASRQILVSPPLSTKPMITASGKTVVVELDSLKDSTTYVIGFGKAIVDVNEGNALDGYRFVFSTGSQLDSLMVSGRAVEMATGKPLVDAWAMLHDSRTPDTQMWGQLPEYYAKCDANGDFKIQNVAKGDYRLVVLLDKNDNYLLDDKEELAGFLDKVISLPDSNNHQLWAAPQPPATLKLMNAFFVPPATLMTVFNGDASELEYTATSGVLSVATTVYDIQGDTVQIHLKSKPDSLPMQLVWSHKGIIMDTARYEAPRGSKAGVKAGYKLTMESDQAASNPISLRSAVPIKSIDTTLFLLKLDTIQIPLLPMVYSMDSCAITLERPANEGSYSLYLKSGAVTDIYQRASDSILFSFQIPSINSKGSMEFVFAKTPTVPFIVELLDDKALVIDQSKQTKGVFSMLNAGKYRIRILLDENGNGKWDIGDVRKGIRSERYVHHQAEITVRANWEVEVLLEPQALLDGE